MIGKSISAKKNRIYTNASHFSVDTSNSYIYVSIFRNKDLFSETVIYYISDITKGKN